MNDILSCIHKSFQIMGIPYTKKYITTFLENHQNTQSMLCLSDLYDSYKVENTAGEFEDKEELKNYPGEHISLLAEKESFYFVVVVSVKDNEITYFNEGKKVCEPIEEYFKKWQGYVLFFTKRPDSAEPNYEKSKKAERLQSLKTSFYTLSISAIFATLLYCALPFLFPVSLSLLLIKSGGIAVSMLLLSYTYNNDNSFFKGVCNIGKKANCGNILDSKAAKVFSFLSWSEVGLFYFVSTFLALLIFEIYQIKEGYSLLVGLNIIALPYTLYSVYYQKRIAKSWCMLCLSVQALLIAEFVSGLFLWPSFSMQHFTLPFSIILISGLSTIATWYLIKPLLRARKDLEIAKKDLRKFRQNLPLFIHALNNQPNLSYPKQVKVLRFGSTNPKVHFTLFTSPVCSHCSKAHVVINELLNNFPNEIACTELFAVNNDGNDEKVKIAAHMLQLQKNSEREYSYRAIHEWHADENRKMEKWMAKYPVTGDAIKENMDIIGDHLKIAKSLAITYTPTIVINGKLLPDLYKVEDLETIIPAFLSALENN